MAPSVLPSANFLLVIYRTKIKKSIKYNSSCNSGYCQIIVSKPLIPISYRSASVRYAAKTRCVSYSLHSLIHSGSCANSPYGLRHAPAFVAKVQLLTEASLSSMLAYHHTSQFNIRIPLFKIILPFSFLYVSDRCRQKAA